MYVHCVVADHLADGGRSEWRSHVLWALPKWLHNCCCRNGTKITVAHTFACVKLSHNQYKVTFFIYFYDPAHSAYVRGASHIAPDPSATLCWQPYKSGRTTLAGNNEKFVGFVPFLHTTHAFCYTYNRFFGSTGT